MKKTWCAIQTKDENGKFYAYAWGFSPSDNIASFIQDHKEIIALNFCETKKRACEIINAWRASFRANGTYYSDLLF